MAYNILVCDDAASQRRTACDILGKNGYLVAAEAKNGEEAVELYTKERPDLVLLDITMPLMDGIAALKKILEADKTAVVVMLAAMGQNPQADECLALGAKGFVFKPLQQRDLLDALKKALA